MQDLHVLLINLYKHNSLSINADKTEFMNFVCSHEEADSALTITDDKGNLIRWKKTIRILGYKVNKENNLEDNMAALTSKIALSHNKIKGQLRYMTPKTRKVVLDAKLRGQINLTLPLLLNQPKRIQARAEVLLMRINRWIRGGPTFKVAFELICKDIGCLLPE